MKILKVPLADLMLLFTSGISSQEDQISFSGPHTDGEYLFAVQSGPEAVALWITREDVEGLITILQGVLK